MTLPSPEDRAAGRAPLGLLAFLAMMTSVVAMTIDAVLPALDAISADLGFRTANDRQLVVLLVFAGLGLAQLIFGPVADAWGRKRTALLGWGIYLVGTVMGMLAPSPEWLLAGRFLQGFGAGAPRVVAVAIIRDLYAGRPMARILSLVMTVFMLVPMLAPLLGQGLEALGSWRAIFWAYLVLALVSVGWYVIGVPETLDRAARRRLAVGPVLAAIKQVIADRQSALCIFAAVCIFTSFLTYLATAQQIFEEDYGLGPLFPVTFAAFAGVFAIASWLNGRVVMRLGMWPLCRVGLWVLGAAGLAGAVLSWAAGGLPPLPVTMGAMAVIFVAVALLFSNITALAMEPHGAIAGTASSVVLSASTIGSAVFATILARSYDGSLMPLFAGFGVLALVAQAALWGLGRREAAA
ncbi:MAG: multidrug effflux MFS transporter [Pseudomonadota bacterium]